MMKSDYPDTSANDGGFAVGCAGMIDEAGGIPLNIAIEIEFLIQNKQINGTIASLARFPEMGHAPAVGLCFAYLLAEVLDDFSPGWDVSCGKNATVVNARSFYRIPRFSGDGRHDGNREDELVIM